MKILILNHNLIEHGNYFRAIKFAGFLADKGHDVTMITSSRRWYHSCKYKVGKINMIESHSWSFLIYEDNGWSPLGLIYRLFHLLTNKYDIVYGFSHKPADFIPGMFAKIFHNSLYVTDWCDWYGKGGVFTQLKTLRDNDKTLSSFKKFILETYDRIEERLEELAPVKADILTVISKTLAKRAMGCGVKEENICYVYSGADTDGIKPQDKTESGIKIKLDILVDDPARLKDKIFLGYTANYHPDEELLFKAFEKVCNKYKNVILLAVGPEFRTPKEELLARGIPMCDVREGRRMKECDRILFFNRQPFEMIKYFLGASDILLLPMTDNLFNWGRWPHKTGDYLAAGRPLVTVKVGDAQYIMENRNVACISAPEPEDFGQKIIDMIELKDRWDEFGKNAREIAETVLNWNTIGETFYKKLKEKKPEIK